MSYKVVILLNFIIFIVYIRTSLSSYITGPPCTITSMIPGSPTTSQMEGNCASILTCRKLGGVPIGKCGFANVCCIYPRTCDSRSNQNQTYFTNPGYPAPFNGTISCSITIQRVYSPFRICQLRLDFVDFELNLPNEGDCIKDRFEVSGQNANSVIPIICGRNAGQHLYMDIDGAQGPFFLRVLTSGPGYRRWNIRVSQIECANPSRAPSNCLQYFTGPAGTFSSFNYDAYRPLVEANIKNMPQDATYFNNMDYAICFRKEIGFCTQTYHVNTTLVPMEISAYDLHNNRPPFDSKTHGGAGVMKCHFDYLILDGIRYCGARLSSLGLTRNDAITDTPIYDGSNGPFIARFVSNGNSVGRGFQIVYQQNPCGSKIPKATV